MIVSQKLPESAQLALAEIAKMLASGFTGTIELQCNQGGIRTVRTSSTVNFDRPKNHQS